MNYDYYSLQCISCIILTLIIVATVGFEQLSLTVNETDDSLEVCVAVHNPDQVLFDIFLTYEAKRGSAGIYNDYCILIVDYTSATRITDENDFVSNQGSMYFNGSAAVKRECFNVSIIDDQCEENTQSFLLLLDLDPQVVQGGIQINSPTEIFILDNDGISCLISMCVLASYTPGPKLAWYTLPILSHSTN